MSDIPAGSVEVDITEPTGRSRTVAYTSDTDALAALLASLQSRIAREERSGGGATPPAWTAVTFENGWVNYGGTWEQASCRKLGDNVSLRGLIRSGTVGATMFTLPAGFRPPEDLLFAVDTASGHGRLDVLADGRVLLTAGSNAYVGVNCSFSVTP